MLDINTRLCPQRDAATAAASRNAREKRYSRPRGQRIKRRGPSCPSGSGPMSPPSLPQSHRSERSYYRDLGSGCLSQRRGEGWILPPVQRQLLGRRRRSEDVSTDLEEQSRAGGPPLTVARDSEVMCPEAVLDVWQRQGGVS